MWDTVQELWGQGAAGADEHLSHDRPCPRCGHAMHTFLACDASCGCEPVSVPGNARAGGQVSAAV